MKKILFACVIAASVAGRAFAQEEPTAPPPSPTPSTPTSALSKVTSTLNVFSAQWIDAPPGITVKPLSLGYSLFVNYKLPLVNPFAVLMVGPGISVTNFRTNAAVFYTENMDSTYLVQLQPTEYKRNKMTLVHVDLPVELRLSTRPKKPGKAWYIAPGFVAGVLVNDYVKRVGEDVNGNTTKQKIYYTRNLSKYHYGVSVRVGYGLAGLYGSYELSPLFEDGKGPGMTFYKVGLTFGGF